MGVSGRDSLLLHLIFFIINLWVLFIRYSISVCLRGGSTWVVLTFLSLSSSGPSTRVSLASSTVMVHRRRLVIGSLLVFSCGRFVLFTVLLFLACSALHRCASARHVPASHCWGAWPVVQSSAFWCVCQFSDAECKFAKMSSLPGNVCLDSFSITSDCRALGEPGSTQFVAWRASSDECDVFYGFRAIVGTSNLSGAGRCIQTSAPAAL